MSKVLLTAAGAAGYVLGARAGRQRYEQISTVARRVWRDPRVQKASTDVQDLAAQQVRQAAPVVKDKVADAKQRVTHSSSAGSPPPPPPPVPPSPTSVTPPVSPQQPQQPPPPPFVDDSVGGPA